jgi:hypothetical protein
MAVSKLDHQAGGPRTRGPEPTFALLGLASAVTAALLTGAAGLWVVLDMAALLAATAALATGLRRLGRSDGRNSLTELGNGLMMLGIAGALLLFALRGPTPRITAAALLLVSGFGGLFALLVLGRAVADHVQERSGVVPAPRSAHRPFSTPTAVAVVTLLIVIGEAVTR